MSESCSQKESVAKNFMFGDSAYLAGVPQQPGEESWKFIEELKSPLWTQHKWEQISPDANQTDLSSGIDLIEGFPDSLKRLETAYEDLGSFFSAGNIPVINGKYAIETFHDNTLKGESFRLEIDSVRCKIIAGETEGIRRGIFYLEDLILQQNGPYLPHGTVERQPFIERRISRCFFGPIKRPPKMRDELLDDTDYYPDQYLNRLAHEGVNGLWLTVEFRDLVATEFTPDAGKDAEKRLAKLRKTVDKCLRYGISTYIFCIEPRAWEADNPVIKNYPELAGAPAGRGNYFCPMSRTAYNYLYESVNKIFRAVPGLGGMINITHGERATTCLSAVPSTSDHKGLIKCPRCSDKEPWEILHASLSAMEKGMHNAAPDAELISWLYMPQPQRYLTGDPYDPGDWVYDLPAHTPENVILQFNFESGVSRTEFGKLLVGGDYWISNPGPASRFSRIAEIAAKNGTKVSAKIQTGNSHEVATTPFVPVPSLLYRKFRAMRQLGVSHTMLCWYFGNYPGMMNKAAGLLSMEPFPENEDLFLQQLASVYWQKKDVPEVIKALKLLGEGYENYPLTNLFQYYGPMHDGPVWPLLLKPADAPLSPTWQIGSATTLKPWPPGGDRVGECIGDVLTLEEVVELTRRITTSWEKGVEILTSLQDNYKNDPERLADINVAKALGIQFRSGYNILNFYLFRERMFRMEGMQRLDILKQLKRIIKEEIKLDEQLLSLCEKDSRLGFHSEAEGYKYFPEKIRWRMQQLRTVLANDIPEVRKIIKNNELLFPEYTGKKPVEPIAEYIITEKPFLSGNMIELPANIIWQKFNYCSSDIEMKWASISFNDALYFIVAENEKGSVPAVNSPFADIEILIEPQRLYPAKHFVFNPGDSVTNPVHITGYPLLFRGSFQEMNNNDIWYAVVRIPHAQTGLKTDYPHPIRIDVIVRTKDNEMSSWRPDNPTTSRLILGSDNPADLGWLVIN